MNVVFDLGGVVVAYDRAALLAELYPDPVVHAAMTAGINEHLNWVEMDRGTLPEADAIVRAAERAGVGGGRSRPFHAAHGRGMAADRRHHRPALSPPGEWTRAVLSVEHASGVGGFPREGLHVLGGVRGSGDLVPRRTVQARARDLRA